MLMLTIVFGRKRRFKKREKKTLKLISERDLVLLMLGVVYIFHPFC